MSVYTWGHKDYGPLGSGNLVGRGTAGRVASVWGVAGYRYGGSLQEEQRNSLTGKNCGRVSKT